MRETLVVTNARVIGESEILDNAAIVIEEGRIRSVIPAEVAPREAVARLDAGGAYVAPGLIDTHNDGLEAEINPRPHVNLAPGLALANFERRAIAAAITTCFHAIMFADVLGKGRTVDNGVSRADIIEAAAEDRPMTHEILHRLDIWSPDGIDPMLQSLDRRAIKALSLNDHTPGQGQYRDLETMKRTFSAMSSEDPANVERDLLRRMAERAADGDTVPAVLARIQRARATRDRLVVASHDDDTAEKVDAMVEVGATVAEFPVTVEAARRARAHGMHITIGAPNIVRGGSASGNVAASDLVAHDLADIICADYHAPSLLVAAVMLARRGFVDLPRAIAMVTANPARAFFLEDRGRLEPGLRGDLCVFRIANDIPSVTHVVRGGEVVFWARPPGELARSGSQAGPGVRVS